MKIKDSKVTGKTTRKAITVGTDKGDMLFTATITQEGYDITGIDVTFVDAVWFDPTEEEIIKTQEFVTMNL